jgi:DNA-binding MarR family transcriptional regulator
MAEEITISNPLQDLDGLIHAPARLGIMANLYVVESADFIFLKNLTGLTWGNLSAHLTKLENAGYVKIEKTIVNKKTHSVAELTVEGRRAFEKYRDSMRDVLDTGA